MADTYTSRLRGVKQTVGGNSGTWGTLLNTLFDLLDDAIAGMTTVSTTGGTVTLTTANNSSDEARRAILKITGVLVSSSTIEVPAVTKLYKVWNATSGAYTCTVKTSGGTGIAVTQGKKMDLFCDGTDVLSTITELQSPTISGATLTTPTITVADNLLTIQDNSDTTKQAQFQASGITTGTTRTVTLPDKNGTMAMTSDVTGITLATEQASTSGTSIDFTGIPAGVKRITIMFKGVSTNGTSNPQIQIGDSGGVETTSYTSVSASVVNASASVVTASTTGFLLAATNGAASVFDGSITLSLENSGAFSWVFSGTITGGPNVNHSNAGSKSLSAELDRVRITTVNGTDAFDAGAINISYE